MLAISLLCTLCPRRIKLESARQLKFRISFFIKGHTINKRFEEEKRI